MTCGLKIKTDKIATRRVMLGAALLTALLATAGCEIVTEDDVDDDVDEGTPPSESLVDPCRSVSGIVLEDPMLENFETGIATFWWVSHDGSPDFDENDDITMELLPGREPKVTPIPGGRCGVSQHALNIKATGLAVYGGGFGINFFPDPLDLSEWDGVSFWARRGEASNETLFFAVSEKQTDQKNGAVLSDDGEEPCQEVTNIEEEKCDRFGVGVGLGLEWRFYKLAFDKMKQRGFGKVAPLPLDKSALVGLNISFETGDWDIWIDDVAFYKEVQ